MAAFRTTSETPLSEGAWSALSAAVEQLPAADREILSFLLDVLGSLISMVDDHTSIMKALDRLDDLRAAEIGSLRELVEAYAPTAEPPVALASRKAPWTELVPAPSEPSGAASVGGRAGVYFAEVQRLRERRALLEGETTRLRELHPHEYEVTISYDPAGEGDPIPWSARVADTSGVPLWHGWRGTAAEALEDADATIAALRRGEEVS